MHLSEAIWVAILSVGAGSLPSLTSFVQARIAERGKSRLEQGRNELQGRRVSMEEITLVVDALKDDLERTRTEFQELRDRHTEEQAQAAEKIAQHSRDLQKEQRRSNMLHEQLIGIQSQLSRLRTWLQDNGIQVPFEINGS